MAQLHRPATDPKSTANPARQHPAKSDLSPPNDTLEELGKGGALQAAEKLDGNPEPWKGPI